MAEPTTAGSNLETTNHPTPNEPPQAAPLPAAVIRPYDAKKDQKLVRYLIGAGVMEPSSLANRNALFKPISLLICIAMAHFFTVRFSSGYPAWIHNSFSSNPKPFNALSPIWQSFADSLLLFPLFLGPPIIVLALFEMRHRALFEAEMRRAIGEEDLRDITKYYGVKKTGEEANTVDSQKEPEQRKGFWVLEYENRILGLIGIDGRKPGQRLDSIMDHLDSLKAAKKNENREEGAESTTTNDEKVSSASTTATSKSDKNLRSRNLRSLELPENDSSAPSLSVTPPSPASGSAPSPYALTSSPLPDGTLHLRRFTTSMSFRSADIEDDLLEFAAKSAFSSTPPSDSSSSSLPPARQLVISLRPTVQTSLKRKLEKHGWTLVPKGSELEVPLSGSKSVSSSPPSTLSKTIEAVWPLSLEPRTMVLKRSTWEDNQRFEVEKAVSTLFGGKGVKVTGNGL
ncbi:hypothetical protein JCM3765_001930 [Sporobolomyces pararoseus]